jgi:hypothetical protein
MPRTVFEIVIGSCPQSRNSVLDVAGVGLSLR